MPLKQAKDMTRPVGGNFGMGGSAPNKITATKDMTKSMSIHSPGTHKAPIGVKPTMMGNNIKSSMKKGM